MKRVEIYTDGACSNNPGPGGWGCILIYGEHKKELHGSCAETTNNRMELMAAIAALNALKEPCEVKLYTDSAYLFNAVEKNWLRNWMMNGWKTSNKKDVSNQDLWLEMLAQLKKHKITFYKVKGHADNQFNNRCDELARLGAAECTSKEAKN